MRYHIRVQRLVGSQFITPDEQYDIRFNEDEAVKKFDSLVDEACKELNKPEYGLVGAQTEVTLEQHGYPDNGIIGYMTVKRLKNSMCAVCNGYGRCSEG